MPAITDKLGPGTVSLGEVGTEIDFSCQVTSATVAWDTDADDDTVVLCGETVPGARRFTATFGGTLFQDLSATAGEGIVEFTWTHKGETLPLIFVPSDAAAKAVTGDVTLVPLSVGGDEAGSNMTSDFEWDFVGEPVLGTAPVVGMAAANIGSRSSDVE